MTRPTFRVTVLCALCFFLAVLTGCESLTPEAREGAIAVFDDMMSNGQISYQQYDALKAALTDRPVDWTAIGTTVAGVAIAIATGGKVVLTRANTNAKRTTEQEVARAMEKAGVTQREG